MNRSLNQSFNRFTQKTIKMISKQITVHYLGLNLGLHCLLALYFKSLHSFKKCGVLYINSSTGLRTN